MDEKFVHEKSFVHEKPLYMKREQKKVNKLSAIKLPPMCKVNYCPCREYKNHLCWSHSKLP